MLTLNITTENCNKDALLTKLRSTSGLTTQQWSWLHYLITHPERRCRGQLAKDDRRCCLGQMCEMFFPSHFIMKNGIMIHRETNSHTVPSENETKAFGLFSTCAIFNTSIECTFNGIRNPLPYISLVSLNDNEFIYNFPNWHIIALVCLTFPSNVFTTYTD